MLANFSPAGGRVARPFAFHKIVSAPRSNTTPVRPLRVKILNLRCPVLTPFQGRGFCFGFPCQLMLCGSLRSNKTQRPHLSRAVTDGAREVQNQRPAHPPGMDAAGCAPRFHKKSNGQPGLSGAGRLRFGRGVLCAYCCGAFSSMAAAAAAGAFESVEIAPLGAPVLLLTSRVR
jgi:hypothetical protein